MAHIILPSRFNKQPQGPVELSAEYFDKSALAYSFSIPGARNLAQIGNGRTLTPVNAQMVAGPKGLGVRATSDKAYVDLAYGNPIVTSDGSGTGDYLIAGVIHPQPSASRGAVLHIRDDTTPYGSVTVMANGYYADNATSGTDESGSLWVGDFRTAASSGFNARGVKAAGVITGDPVAFAAHRSNGTFEIFVNGRLIASNTTSVNDFMTGTQGLAIGGWTVLTTLGFTDPIHTLYAANRALEYGEGEELTRNPWQLFRSKPRVLYFDVGAGGVTGTGSLTTSEATASGSGVLSHTGTGAATISTVTASGAGTLTHTGTGALTTTEATADGTGTVTSSGTVTGTGAITVGAATASGAGVLSHTGTGALSSNVVTLSGAGVLSHTGTGAITVGNTTVSGSGFLGSGVTGTGSITIGNVTVSGTGTRYGWDVVADASDTWSDVAANADGWSIVANASGSWTVQ